MELNEFSHVTPYWYRVQPNVLTEPLRLLDSPDCCRMVRNFFNRNRRTASQKTVVQQSTNPATNSSEFGTLRQSLQQELQHLVGQPNRLQIRCAIREGILLVLAEHLLHVEPDPQQTFVVLEQTVRELAPNLLKSDPTCSPTVHSRPLPVRLYLQVAGYQQPYALHSFTLLEPDPIPSPAFFVSSSLAAEIESESIAAASLEPIAIVAQPDLAEPEPIDEPTISEAFEPEQADTPEADTELKAPEFASPEPAILNQEVLDQEALDQAIPDQAIPDQAIPDITAVEPAALEQPIAENVWSQTPIVDRSLETIEDTEDAENNVVQSNVEEWHSTTNICDEVDLAVDPVETNDLGFSRLEETEFVENSDTAIDAVSVDATEIDAVSVDATEIETVDASVSITIDAGHSTIDNGAETAILDNHPDESIVVESVDEADVLDDEPIASSLGAVDLVEEPEASSFSNVVIVEPDADLEVESIEISSSEETEHSVEALSIDQSDETAIDSAQDLIPPVTLESCLVEPYCVSSIDESERTEITNTETQNYTENEVVQDNNQEKLDGTLEIDQTAFEPELEIVEQDVAAPSTESFISPYKDAIVPFALNQLRRVSEAPIVQNLAEQSPNTETSELTVSETETTEGMDSVAISDLNTDYFADITSTLDETSTLVVEPMQNQVAPAAEDAESVTDSPHENSEQQDSHSIANNVRIEPISFNEVEPFAYYDQSHNGLNHANSEQNGSIQNDLTQNGSTIQPLIPELKPREIFPTEEKKSSAQPEDTIQPIRLIPSVQDSVSSFDRLPLDVGDTARKSFRSRLTLANVMLTGAVGLFFVVGGVYVLTRPCVLGRQCAPLQQAQQLTQRALATLQTNPSALEVVDAYDQLTQANQLLEMIPLWSRYHQQAQTLTTEYSSKVEELSLVVKALNQANTAAKKSLNPPHPIQVWREVQWTWREAINLLEQVPTESSVYALAQDKLAEYQSNLGSINSRIVIEQNALDRLEAVKKAAEVTDARSKIVNSIESWQQTTQSWQTILDQLQQIPQGTMAHAEAQRLTRSYQLQLDAAEKRRSQEELSANAYNQAIGLADQARQLDQQGQWSEAIDYWREAITTIKQVPEATTYYTQAQTQLSSYFTALNQSEQSVKQMTLVQTVEPQLERICSGSYELCTYTLTTEAIRVQMSSEYDQIVVQGFRSVQLNGNSGLRADAADRVNQFLQSLASISESAQVPVELYSAGGTKFGTYDLNQSAYVAP